MTLGPETRDHLLWMMREMAEDRSREMVEEVAGTTETVDCGIPGTETTKVEVASGGIVVP